MSSKFFRIQLYETNRFHCHNISNRESADSIFQAGKEKGRNHSLFHGINSHTNSNPFGDNAH